jgi:hypothetical protein
MVAVLVLIKIASDPPGSVLLFHHFAQALAVTPHLEQSNAARFR